MKTTITGVIATLMLLGLLSAAGMPKTQKQNVPVMMAGGGGPMPLCYPGDPCPPTIPTGNAPIPQR